MHVILHVHEIVEDDVEDLWQLEASPQSSRHGRGFVAVASQSPETTAQRETGGCVVPLRGLAPTQSAKDGELDDRGGV